MLLRQLPPESAFQTAVRGYASWTQDHELLASIYDAAAGANWQRAGRKARRPKPFPRPGRAKAIGRAIPVSRMREILDNWGSEN